MSFLVGRRGRRSETITSEVQIGRGDVLSIVPASSARFNLREQVVPSYGRSDGKFK
jgi:hypothetical protein